MITVTPRLPAWLFPVSAIRRRRQADGRVQAFTVVSSIQIHEGVPSKLDGFDSSWCTREKIWVPVPVEKSEAAAENSTNES